ncbi:hypothetical protein PIB30_080486 [Stylosanthes scabra]|uniref:Pectinesterase inhibitor domain-containing protein n=1 Tax=Stylosanthes scabra TaxID=79078 RepID=A0ABU6UTS4_9FABA|nr:hypothetical protein [Stylosanthes scabra]
MTSSTLSLFKVLIGLILIISHVAHAKNAPSKRVSPLVGLVCKGYGIEKQDRARCTQEMLLNPKISSEKDSGKLRVLLLDLAIKKATEARISLEKMAETNIAVLGNQQILAKYPEALSACAKYFGSAIEHFRSAALRIKSEGEEIDLVDTSMDITIAGDQLLYCERTLADDHIFDQVVNSIIHKVKLFQRMISMAFDL